MSEDEFAPVTPGEMLKEEFLAEYRPGLSATYTRTCKTGIELWITNRADYGRFHTRIVLMAPEKATIEAISQILDQQLCVDFSTPPGKRRTCRAPKRRRLARAGKGRKRSG